MSGWASGSKGILPDIAPNGQIGESKEFMMGNTIGLLCAHLFGFCLGYWFRGRQERRYRRDRPRSFDWEDEI